MLLTSAQDAQFLRDYGQYGYQSMAGNTVDDVLQKVKDMAARQGITYDGAFSNPEIYTKSTKAGVKLDWNINEFNKASVRWSLVSAKQLKNTSGRTSVNDDSYSYPFKSLTNSFTAELQSRISPNVSNELRASYVRVRDQRDVSRAFPMISIRNVGSASLPEYR